MHIFYPIRVFFANFQRNFGLKASPNLPIQMVIAKKCLIFLLLGMIAIQIQNLVWYFSLTTDVFSFENFSNSNTF